MSDVVRDVPPQVGLHTVLQETIFGDVPLRAADLLGFYEDARGDVTAIFSPEGRFGYVSPACRTTLGWDPTELVGRCIVDLVHPEDLPAFHEGRRAVEESSQAFVATYRLRRPGGDYLWTESVLRRLPHPRWPDAALLVASIRDVAERKLTEGRLQRQALTDPLTGIANRTMLMDRLAQALLRLERSDRVLAVIYLDLDRFKTINDSLGHKVGDLLLIQVVERTMATIRATDTLARIGGDELVVLAEGFRSLEEAKRIAARVRESIEKPFDLDAESIVCTTSIGVATTTDFTHDGLELLREADLALYRAKHRGRNRVEVYDEELRTAATDRLVVERMVKSAILEGRIRVHYQPTVDLRSGHVVRAEALVRIEEDDQLLLPEAFLGVAEEAGLLVTIDEIVLSHAMTQAAKWAAELSVSDFGGVAVNITGRHLASSRLVQVISRSLAASELATEALAFEVTEAVLLDASESAIDCLRSLRAMGVRVGLDGFGTGYSSLAHLRQFPVDFLKIDQSIVQRLVERDTRDAAIVRAIVDLAHALDLWVVAEGVETTAQLDTLSRLGCDHAQGFLFGRAEESDEIGAVIERRSALCAP
jgi:diguanylate cyclase (GGDEF)-like protein/PAS domain S-box-containing protein